MDANKKQPIKAGDQLLQMQGVGKAYPDGNKQLWVLKDFDFSLCAGEHVAIVGASGSGKSTLMNLLGLLDVPTCGQYTLLGQDIGKCNPATLAGLRNTKIGFVFQSFCLVEGLTALENVELPLRYAGVSAHKRRQKAREILCALGLGERLDHTPARLSGGQQQRVAIARALVNDPMLILADEPTGNLDPVAAKELTDLLERLAMTGRGVVTITHDERVANCAMRRVLIAPLSRDRQTLPMTQPEDQTGAGSMDRWPFLHPIPENGCK